MNKAQIAGLVTQYSNSYQAATKDQIWQQHSTTFRQFWSGRVLAIGAAPITDDECDVIIRILDRNGKGNTKADEAVAKAMVPQGAWRKMFKALQADQQLAKMVDGILQEKDLTKKAELVDKLYKANEENKNWLTGESGNVLNALLAAYDPVNNLTVISLNDRKKQIDFLELKLSFNWDGVTIGQRIVQSNVLIRDGTGALGVEGSARTKSCFWYFDPVRSLWKPEDSVKTGSGEGGQVSVTVPENVEAGKEEKTDQEELRESLQMQAILAEIGALMGFQIWLPRADRARVLSKWKPDGEELLEQLPVGFDQATMKTIEQIDVLWIKRRSIIRAFEVEHTTSVYSGLLRMADLLAMQPNLKTKLHIVAPVSRREKVLQEIRRPVFMLLEGGALSETCTYLSYDMVADLRGQDHLSRLSDKVIEDYEEKAEEED